jgi:hypothetical protein
VYGRQGALSTSPFRKLRIAESEYGLQNFTESGYGFQIYGIEMDMYGISRGIIFFFGNRRFDTYGFHGFTDSVRIPPKTERQSPTPRPTRSAPPPRARGIPLGLEPHHGVEQGNNLLPLAHFTGGQRAQIMAGAQVFAFLS